MHMEPIFVIRLPLAKPLFDRWQAQPDLLLRLMSKEQLEALDGFIVDRLADRDGGPGISARNIDKLRFDDALRNGSFLLHLQLYRLLCCSDVMSCSYAYIYFTFACDGAVIVAECSYFPCVLDF